MMVTGVGKGDSRAYEKVKFHFWLNDDRYQKLSFILSESKLLI
jgi:hypothetical protein